MKLGELLLAERLLTPAGLEEALESQVVHGGRLGTNLVELGLVQERDLARILGKQHNAAFASGEMKPHPQALEKVDRRFADDKDLLPMRVDATRLTVAVINPHDYQSLDSIAFRTGKRVVPVVIPEFRMNQLLRRYCKAFRPMQSIDMDAVRPARSPEQLAAKAQLAPVADLIDEEEFQKMYAQALQGGAEPAESVMRASLPSAPVATAPSDRGPMPMGRPSAPPVAQPLQAAPMVSAALVPEPEPEHTVPTFVQAQQQLSQSSDREEIGRTILRFARSKWQRALLLSVQGGLVTGWQGEGEGVQRAAVQRIGIQLSGDSTFRLVCSTRSHYVGPMKATSGTEVFYQLLGSGYPATAVLLPLLVRGKVVHLLYLDDGPGQLTPPDVAELLILSQSVARCYEALMKRRKSASGAATGS